MVHDAAFDVARRDIEACMRLIVLHRGPAYRPARRIWSTAMRHATDADTIMGPLWLIWGALTDWLEQKPVESQQAEAAIVRAAAEWRSLPESAEAQQAYFDRWLYGELGYERPRDAESGAPADSGGG